MRIAPHFNKRFRLGNLIFNLISYGMHGRYHLSLVGDVCGNLVTD